MKQGFICLLVAVALALSSRSLLQESSAQVHMGKTKMANAFVKPDPSKTFGPLFRVDVDLIQVRASVTDRMDRYIQGLEKEHFRLYEDKIEQEIVYFAQDNSPISMGLILDISGSMKPHFATAKKSLTQLLEKGKEEDEFFLITFNNKVSLEVDFTNQATRVRNNAALRLPGGRTALYDAVYMGLEKIQSARHGRKALIIITDGEDNSSRYTFHDVKELARETDVQIYALAYLGDTGMGASTIQNLVKLTGGRWFYTSTFSNLEYYVNQIHDEICNQYMLGYHSQNNNYDGKWRNIKIRLEPPKGSPPCMVRARQGYYARKH